MINSRMMYKYSVKKEKEENDQKKGINMAL